GFSAGFSGLLSGIGVFAGFAAFPLLGWGVLGAALLIGGYVGIKTAQNTALEYQKKQSTNLMKHMHQQLTQTTIERTISAQLYQITDSLTKTPAEKKKLYKLISQPLYSSLNSLSSHPLHLNSFFKPSSNHSFNRVVTNDYGMVANQTCR
ncbi:MAG: hypothetical protein PSV35_05190, partial [bacterium]|nr:hypothetical protein [bacterium]